VKQNLARKREIVLLVHDLVGPQRFIVLQVKLQELGVKDRVDEETMLLKLLASYAQWYGASFEFGIRRIDRTGEASFLLETWT
jgi:hypothetical protein